MAVAVVFLPLLAAVIAGFFGRVIGDRGAQLVTCGALLLSAALGILLFRDILASEGARVIPLASWIVAGGVDVDWSLRLDTLSGVMILVVTVVSSMVHVYSIGYMAEDPSIPRFMAYLSLFTFFMLALVTADNFVQLFFGWEGVGLMSYLLVGFWYDRPSANAAAIKAFLVNRVGDFGFCPRHIRGLCDLRLARFRHRLRRSAEARRHDDGVSRLAGRFADPRLHPVCSSARWENRRRSRCTPGCPTRWRARPRSPP